MKSLRADIGHAEKRAKELKSELDANKLQNSDPRYKEYAGYVDIVNQALGLAEKSWKELEWIEGKLNGLLKELDSHKDKVLTKADIERIIKQLEDLSKEIDALGVDVGKLKDLMNDETYNKIKDFLKQLRGDLMYEAEKKLKQVDADLDKLLWRV